jgi:hypothetical protein
MKSKPDEPTQDQKNRREALLKEYSEIGSNFRALTEIRFKLLGLLPLTALAGAALKPEPKAPETLPFALFGLAATLCLVTYNKRNDQLYDGLIQRAAAIEREIGIPDGAFAHRQTDWLSYGAWAFRWSVGHRSAISAVYLATIAMWLFLALESAQLFVDPSKGIVDRSVLAEVVVVGILASSVLLKEQERRRKDSVEEAIRSAFGLMVEHVSGRNGVTSGGFLRSMDWEKLAKLCARANGREPIKKIKSRIRFYSELDAEGMRRYVTPGSNKMLVAQTLGLLTDLSPIWIYDVSSGRRG